MRGGSRHAAGYLREWSRACMCSTNATSSAARVQPTRVSCRCAGLHDGCALLHVRVHGPGLARAGGGRSECGQEAARLCVAHWAWLRAAAE